MGAERIDGIKYNVDRLTDEEVTTINGNLLDKHRRLMGDIERVTGIMAVRGLAPELASDETPPYDLPVAEGDLRLFE